ncbi:V-type proton ATPase subunit S1 [Homalodisca vitripennis]|nr:V-type proton ATPase subunit S1 [Homalodisca vitripennis]KAG8287473.1 positive regulation of osteoclast development [Homalodisca vitripennis]
MASARVLACVIFSLFNIVCGNVPVLLWESSKSDRVNSFPALHRISSEDFQQYVLKKVHGEQPVPLIAVFSEESLSMEDYSWKDSQGQGYFPQLKYITENAANMEFLPSVQDPIDATKQLSEFGYSLEYVDSDKTVNLPDGCGKVLVVKLQEAEPDEDRPELLRRHDVKIAEIYSKLLSKCSHVIGFLSGQQSSWVEPEEVSRMKRSPDDNNTSTTYTLYQDAKATSLFYSTSPPVLVYEGKDVGLGNYTTVVTGDNSKAFDIKLSVKYTPDYRVMFNFDNKTNGYWYLRTIDVQYANNPPISLKSPIEIAAPLDMSFHSGSKVVFRNGSTTLTFSDFQMQPFFLNMGSRSFGDAVDAVEFFTPAIWSGIFVTFLLGIIFTWGITMIMDIRTMDQFDDPKGKTITVSATD